MSTFSATLQLGRARGWCFTINNFSEEEKDQVMQAVRGAKYGIAETEIGEEGTPHIQGYIYYDQPKCFNQVRRDIGQRAYLEKAKGNPKQNYDYCSKESTVFIEKPLGKSGGTIPFIEMMEDMKTMKPEEFAEKYPHFWLMHRDKVLQVMIDNAMHFVKDYQGELHSKNIWLWGAPGLGKSRWAALQGDYTEIFKKNVNKWWDGYLLLSTKIVIIEDYPSKPAGNMLVQHMKIWGDRYPFQGECKGSHVMIEPGRFFLIVTSNYPIHECFDNEEDIRAIKRRFNEVEIHQGDFYNQGITKLDRAVIQQ